MFQVVFCYQLTPEKSIEMKSFEIWRQTEMFYANGVHCVKRRLGMEMMNAYTSFTWIAFFLHRVNVLPWKDIIIINCHKWEIFSWKFLFTKVHYTTFCFHFVFVKNVFRKMLQIIGIFLFRHSEAIFLFA